MKATPKDEKTECWVNGQWIEYHLSSYVMKDGYAELEKDRYQFVGYGHRIKVDGVQFTSYSRLKFFKGSK